MALADETEIWVNARVPLRLLACFDALVEAHDRDRSKEIRAAMRAWVEQHETELPRELRGPAARRARAAR